MSFVHDAPDFDELLQIVANKRGLSLGLVEKDYWVTHTLWGLHSLGFEVWFKGGTSLSKGFSLIHRFSEDLDLKLEPGKVVLPFVSNWKSRGTQATSERQAYFKALPSLVSVPGTNAVLDAGSVDSDWDSASIRVTYPGRYLGNLPGVMRPFVLLEVGNARVTPFVPRDMTSFVHDELVALGKLGEFTDNRPKDVRCVHPLVTLLEKLDALQKRAPKENREPASFVRHYEDAALIIAAEDTLPPLPGYSDIRALATEMIEKKQIAIPPGPDSFAFALPPGTRTEEIRAAFTDIAPMFWGPRQTLDEAAAVIRGWLERTALPSRRQAINHT